MLLSASTSGIGLAPSTRRWGRGKKKKKTPRGGGGRTRCCYRRARPASVWLLLRGVGGGPPVRTVGSSLVRHRSRRDRGITKWLVPHWVGIAGQAKHPLRGDVSLYFVGSAGDRPGRRAEQQVHPAGLWRISAVPRRRAGTRELDSKGRNVFGEPCGRKLGDRPLRSGIGSA